MTRLFPKPTNQRNQGVTAPVSALDDGTHPVFAQIRAEPARAAFSDGFAIRRR